MKKLLLLGGSAYLLPVIDAAHKLGCHVITCDYLPDNVAHKFSDEYHNISIVDKEAVLQLARDLQIDGVMSFACDPGVVTAAYVAEKMSLPFQCSYRSATILQNKGMFRKFLKENGFNCPNAETYASADAAIADAGKFSWPVMVKPVDSAGSKGVAKAETPEELPQAIANALENGLSGEFIIEEFLEFDGFHSSADAFTIDGELVFCTYSDHMFDAAAVNPHTPVTVILPSSMEVKRQEELTHETQRLMKLLGVRSGIYNIESCVATDGKAYVMEVSPRGGGCGIAVLQKFATGVDLIEREVKQALGLPVEPVQVWKFDGVWCEHVIHNSQTQSGIFKDLQIDRNIKEKFIRKIELDVKSGDPVAPFTGANKALGNIFLRFDSREELDEMMEHSADRFKIVLG